jgi:hypothetical protein
MANGIRSSSARCLAGAVAVMAAGISIAGAAEISKLGVTATIAGSDAGYDYAAIDTAARRLYVARTDGVMSVDLDAMKVTPLLIPGQHVHAVVPLPADRLLSTNGDAGTVTIAQASTGKILANIPAGAKPDDALYDPATKSVFVVNGDAGELTVIDVDKPAAVGRISVGSGLEAAVADGHGRLYVNVEDPAAIAVIDTVKRQLVAHYSLPDCQRPTGLGLDPATGILLSSCRNQKAVAMRAADGGVVGTVAIDRIPDAVIFDAERQMFFIPCARDATLVAISEVAGGISVTGRIPTAVGARTGALDPKTGRFYLPAADFSVSPSGFRQKPGTFRVLVVSEK